ncbi:PatB family C-S lyase [Marinilongibacter aquaticus]|uniref:MalY/PatB family protein n=1 Tax=Marinilongibacter aquaticus TaxID=2975157 RepID=UPI0021BDDC92|nr:PatB family C-S lyase [Marinilongibacter aquaticus]UBM58524.1 PatB family C-S lyase [Marinilongibacter aquaticus]
MTYNFDKPTSRKSTNSLKWDIFPEIDLPMWVADMDFESPLEIKQALAKVVDHQIYGYAWPPQKLKDCIVNRLKERHNWAIEADWIVFLPGLVPGLHAAPRILDTERPHAMTATPAYFHMYKAAQSNGQKTFEIPFIWENESWEMDFESMENEVKKGVGMYMLCNPHNPNGKVFSKEELEKLVQFCLKHKLILVSDEIHCDLLLNPEKTHISAASLHPEIEQQSITLLSPSKTFNIAGIGGSYAIIPNADIRKRFQAVCYGIMPHLNNWAIESMYSAYTFGEPWRLALIEYLRKNHDFLLKEINQIKGLEMKALDATYLAWIKCNHPDPESALKKAGLAVSGAQQFNGQGYFRLNFGTQRSNLELAIQRIKSTFEL